MARPVEKALVAITLAGIALVLIAPWRPVVTETAAATSGVTTTAAITRTSIAASTVNPPSSTSSSSPTTSDQVSTLVGAPPTIEAGGSTFEPSPGDPNTTETSGWVASPSTSMPTTTQAASTTTAPPSMTESSVASTTTVPTTTAVPAATTVPVTTAVPTTTTVSASTIPPPTRAPEEPRRCASVEKIWKWDGHVVEDSCTLAEVKRVMRWAWTGTDDQRRSAIRNSHLLDEVFVALEEVGREVGAGIFHTETRGEWTIRFRNIRWHGGPDFDRAVVAVDYSFHHPDFAPHPWWTVTLVQIDGDWKLSYRRGYCRMATPSLEYHGLEARCPPDPHPEVNEDEYPDAISDY